MKFRSRWLHMSYFIFAIAVQLIENNNDSQCQHSDTDGPHFNAFDFKSCAPEDATGIWLNFWPFIKTIIRVLDGYFPLVCRLKSFHNAVVSRECNAQLAWALGLTHINCNSPEFGSNKIKSGLAPHCEISSGRP